jgi:hypothetical protein
MEEKMKEDEKKYNVNNATQINDYGTQENSTQTVGRKIEELAKDPIPLYNGINNVTNSIVKSLWNIFKWGLIPTITCLALGIVLLYLTHNSNPSLGGMVSSVLEIFGAFILLPFKILMVAWPVLIILGVFVLYSYWMSCVMSEKLYKDPVKREIAQKAMFKANLFGVAYGASKSIKKKE